jgi:hypothetical protein
MERQGTSTTVDSLKKQRQDMEARRGRLIQAIEISGGDIPGLTHRLREVEGEITRLNEAIAVHRTVKLNVAVDGIREHVMKSITRLGVTLKAGDISRAKSACQTHRQAGFDSRPARRASGVQSIGERQRSPGIPGCRTQVVARDGIEPPPPAFSGWRSADPI